MSVFPAAVKLKGFKAPAQHKLRGRFYDAACRQKICLSLMLVRSFVLCYNLYARLKPIIQEEIE